MFPILLNVWSLESVIGWSDWLKMFWNMAFSRDMRSRYKGPVSFSPGGGGRAEGRGEQGGGRSLPWERPFNWAKTLRLGSPLQGKWRAGLHCTHTHTHIRTHTHTPKPSLVIGPAATSSKLLASGWPWRWEEKREVLKSGSLSQTTPNIIHECSSDSCIRWAEALNTQLIK